MMLASRALRVLAFSRATAVAFATRCRGFSLARSFSNLANGPFVNHRFLCKRADDDSHDRANRAGDFDHRTFYRPGCLFSGW